MTALFFTTITCSLHGCGAASSPIDLAAPTSEVVSVGDESELDLVLRTSDGRALTLSDQHGSLVLLFLFATYDDTSLIAHREVERFASAHPDTVVIGIALQPDSRTFSRAFVDAVHPAYTVAYDPSETLIGGGSPLGEHLTVPTLVMLDARGRIVERFEGVALSSKLASMHRRARARGDLRDDRAPNEQAAPLPLLGTSRASETPPALQRPQTTPPAMEEGAILIEPED